MQMHQKINHYPGMGALSRKNNLARNLTRMEYRFPEHYKYVPKTFILPQEAQLLRSDHYEVRKQKKAPMYIVKPESSCQGRGIFLSDDLGGTLIAI